ncbi:MAG: hypothetical protein A2Y10_02640 [Planctomycetes bacterium GWF2_41_51]|nr:MAG: hypothetical protein A2Y10_02640 [Planctomycetes bacterium GWF2_41_51]HBG27446.1 hypothetical protein [Phycisphaerales bacterium]
MKIFTKANSPSKNNQNILQSFSGILFILFLFLLVTETSIAVPACPGGVKVKQPDGTEITVRLRGDEFVHWNESEDGFQITKNKKTKQWVYVIKESGKAVASQHAVGKAHPKSIKAVIPDIAEMTAIARMNKSEKLMDLEQPALAPLTGTMRNLVILVNFSDMTVAYPRQNYDNLFNQVGYSTDGAVGSVKDFYHEISYNALTVQSTVVEPVTLNNGYAYYGADGSNGEIDLNAQQMVAQALQKLETRGFDFSTMDGDGDGWIDGLTIIHAGGGEEYGGNDPDYIWSHQWALASTVTYDGIKMKTYHTEPARRGWDTHPATHGITRIGVICHENGHFLGLPDLYDYDYDSEGAGKFCLMAGGSWNGEYGTTPAHMSAWCKSDLGWITPTLILANGTYTLPMVETNAQVLKLQGDFPSSQYFLVENKQNSGFDSALPGSSRGILIWHVDETVTTNNDDQTHYLVDLEEASGTQHLQLNENEGEDSDYYRAGNATIFNDTSVPNNKSYSSQLLNINITNVGPTGANMAVTISGIPGPGLPMNPNPANGAIDISLNADLSWTAPAEATSHDVYFGTVSPGTFCGNQTGTFFDPGTLVHGTTYYWRIDEKDTYGNISTGTVWSFTTIANHLLTISASAGGTVTTPGKGTFEYEHGTNVSVAASPDPYYFFVKWTGSAVAEGKVANPNSPSTTVLMDDDYSLKANFDSIYNRLIASSTSGGTVIAPGIGSYFYDPDTNVQIEATEDINNFYFINWTGSAVLNGKVADPCSRITNVLMSDDYTVQANYGFAMTPIDNLWTKTYSGLSNSDDYAADIAADSNGNVYVTGYAKYSGTNYDFTTVKYAPDGNQLWIKTYNRNTSNNDYALAITADANSNVIVAGYSYTSFAGYDALIVKYNSEGTQLWTKYYNSTGTKNDRFYDVAADANGNIYAVGRANDDTLIIKYAPNGTMLWTKTYNGSANAYDALYKVAIDTQGNAFACGETSLSGSARDCMVVKYAPDGTRLWLQTHGDFDNDFLESIALGADGSVYVTGSIETETDCDYVTLKYSPTGQKIWDANYSGSAYGWDESVAVAVCPDGNVVVTGYSTAENVDSATIKYNSQTGEQIWVQRYNGGANSTDYTESIAVDRLGNIYAHGRRYENGNNDYLTICYNADGSLLWRMNHNGTAGLDDIGTALVVIDDEEEYQSNVYVTGTTQISATNCDYLTLKYSVDYTPCRQPLGDLTGDCKVDLFDFSIYADSYFTSQQDFSMLCDLAQSWLECGLLIQDNCWLQSIE